MTLVSKGCLTEIIAYQTWLFMPVNNARKFAQALAASMKLALRPSGRGVAHTALDALADRRGRAR
jgi:hypothetical protein